MLEDYRSSMAQLPTDYDLTDFEFYMKNAFQAKHEKEALEREIDAMDAEFHRSNTIDAEKRAQNMELLCQACSKERRNHNAAMVIISQAAMDRMTTELGALLDAQSRRDDPDGTLSDKIASCREGISRIREIHGLGSHLY